MDEVSLQVNLGSVSSTRGSLKFSLVVQNDGTANVQIFGFDPSDNRKAGILLTLDEPEYRQLKDIISKTDLAISNLRPTAKPNGEVADRSLHSFAMIVEDAFYVEGRGTFVLGMIKNGIVKVGDRVVVETTTSSTQTVVRGIEKFGESAAHACKGENVGLLLSQINVAQAPNRALVRSCDSKTEC